MHFMKSSDILNSLENIVVDGKTYDVSKMSLQELKDLNQAIQKMKKQSIDACQEALDKLEIKEEIDEEEENS